MNRFLTFLLVSALSVEAMGQRRELSQLFQVIPPGPPYDPEKHVNPVITYVQTKDFKTATRAEAQDAADLQLLGLSKDIGSLASIELAQAGANTAKDLKLEVRGTFYPVVRQTFKATDGNEVILCSFKPPKITEVQGRMSLGFPIGGRDSKDPKNKRFGPATPPEELEIRGRPGLIFEKEGKIVLAWYEDGVTHTAASSLPRKDLFRVIDDLL